jgi:tripartite ATP-independent transporter DctM subunit
VRVSSGEVLRRLINAILPLLTVVIIIVGVVGGVFTATEAGAVACIYALFLGMFVYKKISWKDIPNIFKEGCLISAAVMLIVVASSAFGYVLTYSHVPENLVQLLLGITENKYFLLFLINVFLLILGTFLDPTPIILLVAPILYPIVIAMGVDPIQFGTMFVLNMAIGNLTPPVGVVLFTAAGIAKVSVESVLKPMIPLWIIMIGILLLVTYVPAFSLFIPNLLMP